MASIRKRKWMGPNSKPKEAWVVAYKDLAGKPRIVTCKTKEEARARRNEIETQIRVGTHTANRASLSVADLCELYIRHCEDKQKDGRVGLRHLSLIRTACDRHVVVHLGRRKVSELNVADSERLYGAICKSGRVIPRTAKAYLTIFKLMIDYAIKREWVKVNVVTDFLRELRGIGRAKIETFSAEEVAALLREAMAVKTWRQPGFSISGRWGRLLLCMINIAAFCGLRYGEIIALRVENIDFEKRMFRVRHSMTDGSFTLKEPKTKSGIRDVPMPTHIAALVSDWISRDYAANPNELVFTQGGGTVIGHRNFYRQQWMPLLERAGLGGRGLHFHALRHFAASWMVDSGMPITDVARLLGHSHFDMTLQTYAHPMRSDERRHEIIEGGTQKTLSLLQPSSPRQEVDMAAVVLDFIGRAVADERTR